MSVSRATGLALLVSLALMHPMVLTSAEPVPPSNSSVHRVPPDAQPIHAPVTASNPPGRHPATRQPLSGCPNCAPPSLAASSHDRPTGPMGCIAAAGCVMTIVLLAVAVIVRGRTPGRWWHCRARSIGSAIGAVAHWRRRPAPSLIELSILRI